MESDSRPVPGRGRKKRDLRAGYRRRDESCSSSDEDEAPATKREEPCRAHKREDPFPAHHRERQDPFPVPGHAHGHRKEDPLTASPGSFPGGGPFNGNVPSLPVIEGTQEAWHTGLFDCFQDTSSCINTAFIPCVTFGHIAEILDEGTTDFHSHTNNYLLCMLFGCPSLYSHEYRTKLRTKYKIPPDFVNDCLMHCFFEPCAVCQEYRELNIRGVNPSIGWIGNQQSMNAPVPHAMRR